MEHKKEALIPVNTYRSYKQSFCHQIKNLGDLLYILMWCDVMSEMMLSELTPEFFASATSAWEVYSFLTIIT